MDFLHVFVLYVFLEGKRVGPKDMAFYSVDDCVYFAQILAKQGKKITSYCLPAKVPKDGTKVY